LAIVAENTALAAAFDFLFRLPSLAALLSPTAKSRITNAGKAPIAPRDENVFAIFAGNQDNALIPLLRLRNDFH
jgi:hypothetical protein